MILFSRKQIDEAVKEFHALAEDVMKAAPRSLPAVLNRMRLFQARNAVAETVLGGFDYDDFDRFIRAMNASREASSSGRLLDWPPDVRQRLGIQTRLLSQIAERQVSLDSFLANLYEPDAKLEDNVRFFRRELLGPYFTDFARLMRDLAEPTDEDLPAMLLTESGQAIVTEDGQQIHVASPASQSAGLGQAETGSKTGHLGTIGGNLKLSRTASAAEAALGVANYARVLSSFFRAAEGSGEFCFALFGPWGRGKTYLVKNHLASLLKTNGYEPIFFNAWTFQRTPEAWVHLYETLVEAFHSGNYLATWARSVRTGIARHGVWPLLGSLALACLGIIPKLEAGRIAAHFVFGDVAKIIGFGGIIWMVLVSFSVRAAIIRLGSRYFGPERHGEKLGLQATIGKDLKALLKGWIPSPFEPGFGTLLYGGLSLIGAASTWYWLGFLAPHQANVWLRPLLVVIATLLAVVFPIVVIETGKGTKRILLVVDDLDRCPADQLLTIVESIKVLLEDPEIQSRVQVLMLVEEEVLNHAIAKKYYRALGYSEIKGFSRQRIILENREKLFTAHLRLPPLALTDLRELLEKILASAGEASGVDQSRPTPSNQKNRSAAQDRSTIQGADPSSPEIKPPASEESSPRSPAIDARSIFHSDEHSVLAQAIESIYLKNKDANLGPRSIRALLFRYQLARLLLHEFDARFSSDMIVAELVRYCLEPARKAPNGTNPVESIVYQVS